MVDVRFIDKNAVSLAVLAEELKAVEEKKEPIAVQQKVKDYALRFSKVNKAKETKLIQAIRDLEIPLLTEVHVVQIANLVPKTIAELQTIFAGSKTTISAENLSRLQEVIKAYEK